MDDNDRDQNGVDRQGDDEHSASMAPPERVHTEAELAMIHAAMLEELGIGRKDALPLQDRGDPIGNIRPLLRQASDNPWANAVFDDVDPAMEELDSIADGQLYRLRRGTSNGLSRGFSASSHGGGGNRGAHASTKQGRGVHGGSPISARSSHSGRGGRGGFRGNSHNVSQRPLNDGRRRINGQQRIDATIARLRAAPSDIPEESYDSNPRNIEHRVVARQSGVILNNASNVSSSRPQPVRRNRPLPSPSSTLFSLANSSAEAFLAYANRGTPVPSAASAPSVSSKNEDSGSTSVPAKKTTSSAGEIGLQGSRWNLPEDTTSQNAQQPAARQLIKPSPAASRTPSEVTRSSKAVSQPASAVTRPPPATPQPVPVPVAIQLKKETSSAGEVSLPGSRWNLPASSTSQNIQQPAPRQFTQPSSNGTRPPPAATQAIPASVVIQPAGPPRRQVTEQSSAVIQPAPTPVISQPTSPPASPPHRYLTARSPAVTQQIYASVVTKIAGPPPQQLPEQAPGSTKPAPAPVATQIAPVVPGPETLMEKTSVKLGRADQPNKFKPVTVTILRDHAKNIILQCADGLKGIYLYETITENTTLFAANTTVTFCCGGEDSYTWTILFPLPYQALQIQDAALPGGRNLLVHKEKSPRIPVLESVSSVCVDDMRVDERLINIDSNDEPIQIIKPAKSALMDLALYMSLDNIDGVFAKINSHANRPMLARLLDMVGDPEVDGMSSVDGFFNSLEAMEGLEMIVRVFFENSSIFGYLNEDEQIAFIEDIAPKILEKAIEDRDSLNEKESKVEIPQNQPQEVHDGTNEVSTHYTVEELLKLRDRVADVTEKIVSAPIREKVVNKPRGTSSTAAFKAATSALEWQSFSAPEPNSDAKRENPENLDNEPLASPAAISSLNEDGKTTTHDEFDNRQFGNSTAIPSLTTDVKTIAEEHSDTQSSWESPTVAGSTPANPEFSAQAETRQNGSEETDPALLGAIISSASIVDKEDKILPHLRGIRNGLSKAGLIPALQKPAQRQALVVNQKTEPESHLATIKLETLPVGTVKHRPSNSDFDRLATQFNTLEVSGNKAHDIKKQSHMNVLKKVSEPIPEIFTQAPAHASTTSRQPTDLKIQIPVNVSLIAGQSTQAIESQTVSAVPQPKSTPKLDNTLKKYGPDTYFLGIQRNSTASSVTSAQSPVVANAGPGMSELKTKTPVAAAALPVEQPKQANQEIRTESHPTSQSGSVKAGYELDNRNVNKSKGLASSRWASESSAPIPTPQLFSPPPACNVPLFQRARPGLVQGPTPFPSIFQSGQHSVQVTPITPINPEEMATVLVPDPRSGAMIPVTGIKLENQAHARHNAFLPRSPLSPIAGFPNRDDPRRHFSTGSVGPEFKPEVVVFSPRGNDGAGPGSRPPLSPKNEKIQANLQQRLSQSMAGRISSPPTHR